jgi:hypothetical protein
MLAAQCQRALLARRNGSVRAASLSRQCCTLDRRLHRTASLSDGDVVRVSPSLNAVRVSTTSAIRHRSTFSRCATSRNTGQRGGAALQRGLKAQSHQRKTTDSDGSKWIAKCSDLQGCIRADPQTITESYFLILPPLSAAFVATSGARRSIASTLTTAVFGCGGPIFSVMVTSASRV